MTDLRTKSLRQSIGHRTMGEGAQQPPFAVHLQVTSRPNRRGAHVARKNGVLRGQLVEHPDHILRMDGCRIGFPCRKGIESLACLLIVFERGPQMPLLIVVLVELWEQSLEGRLRVPHKAIVKLCASAELFSKPVNLD